MKEIDPCEQLDDEVEDLLLQLVDDFVNSTVNTACVFAKHRNGNTVDVKDVQLYLGTFLNVLQLNCICHEMHYFINFVLLLQKKCTNYGYQGSVRKTLNLTRNHQ